MSNDTVSIFKRFCKNKGCDHEEKITEARSAGCDFKVKDLENDFCKECDIYRMKHFLINNGYVVTRMVDNDGKQPGERNSN